MAKPIIWIEGIIGAGKTTMAIHLAKALHMRPLLEPTETNPYLERYYQDPKRWAFSMQIEMLFRRFALQKLAAYESISEYGSGGFNGVILDRGMPGDRVFAKLHFLDKNISDLEWGTYQKCYETLTASLHAPSLLIFIDVDPKVAKIRADSRKRSEEEGIPLKYFEKLHRGYLDLLSEIEAGKASWSRGIEILKIGWNVDHQPLDFLIDQLRKKFDIPLTSPSQLKLKDFFREL